MTTHGGIASWKKREASSSPRGTSWGIQTDKAPMEMESMEEGSWRRSVAEETEDIPVGKPVAVLCEKRGGIAARGPS